MLFVDSTFGRYTILVATFIGTVAQSAVVRGQGASQQRAAKPNVVLVMMDDLGYGDVGSYGAPDARTLNIDRLARQGVRLTDAYANGAVCTPTRAALMSGRYQQRFGLERVLIESDSNIGLPASGSTLPALLKANGYATALFGKWHLGFKREFGPNAHGFDAFYGFLAGAHDYYSGDLYQDTTLVHPSGYLTDELTKRAVAFIDRNAAHPFFLEVAYNAVHWPFEPPGLSPAEIQVRATRPLAQMPGDSVRATRQDYVRMLERADQGIGNILAALERHGLSRNTLVIFTNDNGGEWLSRNAPLFHRKGTLWEGGIRVPLILRWPAQLPAGKTSSQVALTMDVTASILAATGTTTPASYRPDGIDILPMLRGARTVERNVFWRFVNATRQQRAFRSGRWKLLVDGNQLLLFDLANDAGERNDLAAVYPEVVRSLRRLVDGWERDVAR
jgi:arylsulfatase A-like enzyme